MIVVDTREQRPYEFPTAYVRDTLQSGDYSLRGFEDRIAIERKKPSELFTNFTSTRDRFRREWERLASHDALHLIIEGDIYSCATQYSDHSRVNPHVVIASLISWSRRFRFKFHFASDRLMAQALTYRILEDYWRANHQTAPSVDGPGES